MKLTESQLRNIVREELQRLTEESFKDYAEQRPNFKIGGQKFSTVSGLISILDSMRKAEPYRNPEASYDGVHYEIPVRTLKQMTGLGEREIETLKMHSRRQKAGDLGIRNGTVQLHGAA